MTRAPNSDAGFTLLEMLVALSLLGLALTSLPAIFKFARTSFLVAAELDQRDAFSSALGFVEKRLAEATPVIEFADGGRTRVVFHGDPDRLSFVAPMNLSTGDGGLAIYELALEGGAEASDLVLAWTVWRPPQRRPTDAAPVTYPRRSRTLVAHTRSLALRYYGSAVRGQPPQWMQSWPRSDALPELVQLQVAHGELVMSRIIPLRLRTPGT